MNDKLTLQELSAYLPYGIEAIMLEHKIDYVNKYIDKIVGLHQWDHRGELWCVLTEGGSKPSFDRIKPLLRPLSDLTKEIEHNGERFVPIERISEMYGIDIMTDERNNLIAPITLEPYNAIRQLCGWYIDVFNLIPRNLAININTIKQ